MNTIFLYSTAFFLFLIGCTSKKEKIIVEPSTNAVLRSSHLSEFAGSNQCKSCHESEYNDWKGSHHDQAMKVASDSTIEANFNNTKFEIKGAKYHFFRKGKDFIVNTQNGQGQYEDFKVIYTFGVYPLQQYLVEFPDGKYQTLQAAWDTKNNRWMDVQPSLTIATDEWLHWSRGAMNWNSMCADCHSTDLHKNFDSQSESFQTTFSEINVSCESCHATTP